ncbi:formin-like protein 5 [Melanotaenia boesemani]|uniref:formin-like protein 5 n=1 Tax=Melanotaenia boesemani TaxID=1250792 RepID=UPI001C05C7BE|nr:formin-like protein 5 [Melanotaenia boesemani]
MRTCDLLHRARPPLPPPTEKNERVPADLSTEEEGPSSRDSDGEHCPLREGQRQTADAAASTTSSSRTTSASTAATSTALVSASSQARRASQFAAFVSGRRSLSAMEMQAKVQQLVGPKPAFPASLRPALSSRTPEEPTDEELVQAVVDIEGSSGVQPPPLPLHTAPPPPPPAATSSTSVAAVSAVMGEPTDEELLEAIPQNPAPQQPPEFLIGVRTAEAPESSQLESATPPLPAAPRQPAAREELPGPAFLHPPPPAGSAELLPESWRAALTAEQQDWIGRVLFTRDSSGRPRLITSELSLWW